MRNLMTFVSGLVFGLGLIISGMFNPAKVTNFLDVFGQWDPSLMFVMGGAIAVTAPGFLWLRKRSRPWFSESFSWPTRTDLDRPLILGAVVFGAGWGLAGYCPGAALSGVPLLEPATIVFSLFMICGMILAKLWGARELKRQHVKIDPAVIQSS